MFSQTASSLKQRLWGLICPFDKKNSAPLPFGIFIFLIFIIHFLILNLNIFGCLPSVFSFQKLCKHLFWFCIHGKCANQPSLPVDWFRVSHQAIVIRHQRETFDTFIRLCHVCTFFLLSYPDSMHQLVCCCNTYLLGGFFVSAFSCRLWNQYFSISFHWLLRHSVHISPVKIYQLQPS